MNRKYGDTIEFHPNGRGTWKGKAWNGEEWIFWKNVFFSKGEAERFANSKKYDALFVTE